VADNLENLAEQLESEANPKPDEAAAAESEMTIESLGEAPQKNLKLIMDIPLRVSVELGRTKMPVSELLNLGQGSVIELNKLAGEPMEVLVNDKLIARGEAVVINEKFGVRLTDIISTKERVEQLK
jgi:flagellar motor switch protein FliN/FliY